MQVYTHKDASLDFMNLLMTSARAAVPNCSINGINPSASGLQYINVTGKFGILVISLIIWITD